MAGEVILGSAGFNVGLTEFAEETLFNDPDTLKYLIYWTAKNCGEKFPWRQGSAISVYGTINFVDWGDGLIPIINTCVWNILRFSLSGEVYEQYLHPTPERDWVKVKSFAIQQNKVHNATRDSDF